MACGASVDVFRSSSQMLAASGLFNGICVQDSGLGVVMCLTSFRSDLHFIPCRAVHVQYLGGRCAPGVFRELREVHVLALEVR